MTTSETSAEDIKESSPKSSEFAFIKEDVFAGLRSPGLGKQLAFPVQQRHDSALLPFLESSDILPKLLRGKLKVLLNGLPKLLPHLRFCFHDSLG